MSDIDEVREREKSKKQIFFSQFKCRKSACCGKLILDNSRATLGMLYLCTMNGEGMS